MRFNATDRFAKRIVAALEKPVFLVPIALAFYAAAFLTAYDVGRAEKEDSRLETTRL
mgnify:CR=1 FL=1